MRVCDFCGKELSGQADFCGFCGRIAHPLLEAPTNVDRLPAVKLSDVDTATTISTPNWEWEDNLPGAANQGYRPPLGYATQAPLDAEDEEQRRRAAFLGFGVPRLAGTGQPPAGNVPLVQGTPQFSGVPSVSGTPQMVNPPLAPNPAQGMYSAALRSTPTWQGSQYAAPSPAPRVPHPPRDPHRPPSPYHTPTGGCAPVWLVFLFAAILIVSSIISIGLTVLAPTLSVLSGSTNVAPGDFLHLHGSSFIPGSSVALSLDRTIPLYFTDSSSIMPTSRGSDAMMGLDMASVHLEQSLSSSNIVTASVDGAFNVAIPINPNWHTGQHTIRAAEKLSPRSATLTIYVRHPGETPSPSATDSPTDMATPTATASPSVTISPSTTPSSLSCINPTSITLGPVSEGYNQAIATQVSLCTAGSGTVNWTANWNQGQAPWLQLDHSTGQVQAPAQQPINVSAVATNLKPGTYTTTVTFTSQQSSTTETLNVTFTVQAGCIHASQQELSFSGIEGVNDPPAQTIIVSNCGLIGVWFTSLSTSNNANWLSVAPTGGALNAGATKNVTVTTSNLKTKLAAGRYSGKIVFGIGSNQVIVYVSLTVQFAPKIILNVPSLGSFNASKDCTFSPNLGDWVCTASISNSSSSQSLSWKASSSGLPNITFKPSSDTMTPGGGERVQIIVPKNSCQTAITLTFTGPANAVNISWYCTIIP